MIIKVLYQWSEEGIDELCGVDRDVTKTDIECSRCGCRIPAQTPVAKLTNLQGDHLMHWECAIQGCCLESQQKRMIAISSRKGE